MGMNEKIYGTLVNRVPGIRSRYHKYRDKLSGAGRLKAWGYLMKLNAQYYIFRDQELKEPAELYPDKDKKLYTKGSESSLSKREAPAAFAKKLAEYDVISFDVFDTLILRPFSKPTDLFFMVGSELGYLDFERIRQEMEWKAREKKHKAEGHYEVTYDEIWEMISKETGIPKDTGMTSEWNNEKKYCFANPYFSEVIKELQKYHKKMVITSDMYLSKEQIKTLLDKNGYPNFDDYFVSCEYGTSKGTGGLYHIVKKTFGENLTYAHVGDNAYSDQRKAEENGFKSFPYRNVNEFGNQFRAEDMSAITGSMYRGIVNAHLHNGLNEYSMEYEFGFVYGGLFVLGYCQFIHEYVQTHHIDKILFLARDGDILNQVYQKLYPEEADHCAYVYWSRLAATKMAASYFKYDYFRRFLFHKVNQGYTLEKIFASMELEDMLEDCVQNCGGKLNAETILTDKNAEMVKAYLMDHWAQVLAHYDEQLEAGKMYYAPILEGCKKVVAVDVGWAGSGAVTLDYIVNHIWHLDCEVIGLLGGTNSAHNAEPNTSEAQLWNGKLVSYLFSQGHNREMWKFHDLNKGHNIYIELLLSSTSPSFKKFGKQNKSTVDIIFKKQDYDDTVVNKFQEGINDFVCNNKMFSKIPAADIYQIFIMLFNSREYLKCIDKCIKLDVNID